MQTTSTKYQVSDIAAFHRTKASAPHIAGPTVTDEQRNVLDEASVRFLAASGLLGASGDPELFTHVSEDQRHHAHCLARGGFVDINGEVEFLHRVTGYARDVCAAWWYADQVEMVGAGIMDDDWLSDAHTFASKVIAMPTLVRVAAPSRH